MYSIKPLLALAINCLLFGCRAFSGASSRFALGGASTGTGAVYVSLPYAHTSSRRKSNLKPIYDRIADHSRRIETTALLARRSGSKPRKIKYGLEVTTTNILIVFNVIGYLAVLRNPYMRTQLMKIDVAISRGQFYRLFTSCFMHGSFSHLLMNSYSLYNIGPQTEQLFGPSRFLLIYLASGLLANIGTYIAGTSPYALGASGCVFGLLGALGAYFMTNKKILGQSSEYALGVLRRNMFINVLYGFYQPNVDQWAHVGGASAGALLAYLFGPRLALVKSRVGSSYQWFTSWISRPWKSKDAYQ